MSETQSNAATGMPQPVNITYDDPRPYAREQVMGPTRPAEENIIRPIAIRQLSHGYVVEVGCQTFAIESASTLIAKLSEYILNPLATENKHREGKLF